MMHSLLKDIQFWRGLSWRRNALFLALAGMEMSWVTLIFMSLNPRSWDDPPMLYFAGLLGLMTLLMTVAHFLSQRQIDSPLFELIVLTVIVVVSLVLVRLYVFGDEPASSFRWLGEAFFLPGAKRLETFLVLGALAYLWWRGVIFLQRDMSFFIIGYDFRKGVLGLVAGIILFKLLSGQNTTAMVYAFFFFSLVAVALGRVEDKARAPGGEQASGREWLGIITLSSGLVLALAALFSLVWSRQSFAAVLRLLAPAGSVLGRYVEAAALFSLSLLEPLFQWFIAFIRSRLDANAQLITPIQDLPTATDMFNANSGEIGATGPPLWFRLLFNYIIPGAILIVVLVLLVLWLERRRHARRRGAGLERQEKITGLERQGLGGLIKQGVGRLREWASLVGKLGLGRRFYAAISVRYIYANLQKLAASRGYPRHKAQTPNDYLPTLALSFPGQEQALSLITAAYNAVEYGHVPTDKAEMERIRQAWERIQQAARQTPPRPPDEASPPQQGTGQESDV